MKIQVRSFILILLCLPPSQASPALHEVREVHYQMGTFLELVVWHSNPNVAKRIIREAAQEVHRLDGILSNFDSESSVSHFNQRAGKGKTSLPWELYELLTVARRFSVLTSGDFDATVGPLMDLWRDHAALGRLPDRDNLAQVLRQVGYEKLRLYNDRSAELQLPGMKIDLGGIGKGYAVDRVVSRVKAAGIRSALINFGGSSIYALGTPPGKLGWEIGIKGPDDQVRGVIYLHDMALSTSGSMGKFWTIAGKKYGHLIDPKSGTPVLKPRVATAIASTATAAEALTKPLVLRGKTGLRLVARLPGTEALVISDDGALFYSRWLPLPNPLAGDSWIVRNFAYSSFRLRDASFEIRLVYTLFLLLVIGGLATTWVLQVYRVGFSYERIVDLLFGRRDPGTDIFPEKPQRPARGNPFSHLHDGRCVFNSLTPFSCNLGWQGN